MSSLTDTFQPGDVVAFRVRVVSQKGLTGRFSLGSAGLPEEIPENTLTFDGVPLVFDEAFAVFNAT